MQCPPWLIKLNAENTTPQLILFTSNSCCFQKKWEYWQLKNTWAHKIALLTILKYFLEKLDEINVFIIITLLLRWFYSIIHLHIKKCFLVKRTSKIPKPMMIYIYIYKRRLSLAFAMRVLGNEKKSWTNQFIDFFLIFLFKK